MMKHLNLATLATASMLVLSVSCADKYQEGFDAGKKQGYEEGYADGDADGYERAKEYFATADYNDGFNDGKTAGIAIGYASGKSDGYNLGKADGYTQGYNVGKSDGYNTGYGAGKSAGYSLGYDDGYDDGTVHGYDLGFDAGYDDGYDDGKTAGYTIGFDEGYDAGYEDAETYYGFSVGPTKSLRGYANILSMAHNDIFDYKKIATPIETKRGILVNGQLLMSEVSLTNKDTLKRAAVVEQYLVTEMAQQVKAKFGLSADRSMKIAKAANHFRKYASKRALTSEDTNAYAVEILGNNLTSIESAVESARKGDLSDMNQVLKNAAEKNGTSPEKMTEIVTKLFI